MRLLIQHVEKASVSVEGKVVGSIGKGLLVFIGVHREDGVEDCLWLRDKLLSLRIFRDEDGKMNRSLLDTDGELLLVSQFTLYGDCVKGRRPSFTESAPPEKAKKLYEQFIDLVKERVKIVATGIFGAHMKVELLNDGPITFWIDSKKSPLKSFPISSN